MKTTSDRRFNAIGQYGYGVVQEQHAEDFSNGGIHRDVFRGITQRLARQIADELNYAYQAGRADEAANPTPTPTTPTDTDR